MRILSQRESVSEQESPLGFDDFDVKLGDLLRGERATLGKSLLDVQRELRIKASYIAAIENCDPSVFDTPGFIAGYVRSYARYLGQNPEDVFQAFCTESGFSTAHGMAPEASSRKNESLPRRERRKSDMDPLMAPGTPFVPGRESVFAGIEPGAVGSSLALMAVIGLLGFGGYSVFNQIQRVQLTPVEQTPVLLSDLDPLAGTEQPSLAGDAGAGVYNPPADALDRLYRPEALDVPVMVARDAPISTLDPRNLGVFARPELPQIAQVAEAAPDTALTTPRVVADAPPALAVVAVRPSWVRVRAADGSVIFEGTMNAGASYDVPQTTDPATIRVGESGAVYFALNGTHYGPVGPRGTVTKNVALATDALIARYELADLTQDQDLARVVAEAKLPE